jgi:hypothetical protein
VALHRSLNSARTRAVLRCVVTAGDWWLDATMLVVRCTVTIVAWFTLTQPTADVA